MKEPDSITVLKNLIMKYHPDRCQDPDLISRYTEITGNLNALLDNLKKKNMAALSSGSKENSGKNEVIPVRNQDYILYKRGMEFYRNIHPGKFYRTSSRVFKLKPLEEQREILNGINISFYNSLSFFCRVINEFPESQWAADSKEKIQLLGKLYKSYRNFVPSDNNHIFDFRDFIISNGLDIPY